MLAIIQGDQFEEELAFVLQFYGSDFCGDQLKLHLDTLRASFPPPSTACLEDVKENLLSLSPGG